MEQYIQYRIQVSSEEQKDILIALLAEWGIEGFEETDDLLVASGKPSEVDETAIEAYLQLQQFSFAKGEVKNENWNAIWEANFKPVLVDDFVGIRAHFHEPLEGVEHELVITPKMSFGTGHHATTYMVMKLMQAIDFTNSTVFDFGAGTGILAILAEKLGATSVLACDIDEWCIDNATENLGLNNCKYITVQQMEAPPAKGEYDYLLANINKNILLDNMLHMSAITKQGGLVLMSGLLVADEADIVAEAIAHGLNCTGKMERNGWIALVFLKA